MAEEEAIIADDGENDLGAHERTLDTNSPTVIDLEKLADKVSRLMRDELRLEIARGQSAARRRSR